MFLDAINVINVINVFSYCIKQASELNLNPITLLDITEFEEKIKLAPSRGVGALQDVLSLVSLYGVTL